VWAEQDVKVHAFLNQRAADQQACGQPIHGRSTIWVSCNEIEKRFREAPSFTIVVNLIIAVICEAILLLDKDDKDDKAKLHGSFDDAEGTDSEASSFPELEFREQLNCGTHPSAFKKSRD
jgi:hypothetical protein